MQLNLDTRLPKPAGKSVIVQVLTVLVVLAALGLFYLDRNGAIQKVAQSYGDVGVLVAIVAVGVLSLAPLPTESLLIVNVSLYGGWGIFYTWLGSLIGAALIYVLTRYGGRNWLHAFMRPETYQRANNWMSRKGALGILMLRLLPLPACISNYTLACMDSVKPWNYFWTASVSVLPYYAITVLTVNAVSGSLFH